MDEVEYDRGSVAYVPFSIDRVGGGIVSGGGGGVLWIVDGFGLCGVVLDVCVS